METLKIKKSVEINAPKEKVWEVILDDKYNRIWYAEFMEGSHAITDWKEGSKAMFLDSERNGMVGRITTHKPYELLIIEFDGFVMGGVEDYESEGAKATKGTTETYRLIEKEGNTTLFIESDMGEEYFNSMSKAWDKALEIIKKLALEN